MIERGPWLIKLGGSVLTDKARGRATLRSQVLHRLAREIATARNGQGVLVVHGGGSFGHPVALRHGVGARRVASRDVPRVLSDIRRAMDPLRAKTVKALEGAGLAAFSLDSPLAIGEGGRPIVKGLLGQGLVPVAGGDAVLDKALGLRILSGDEILSTLAAGLAPSRVVFVTDVDGILKDGEGVPQVTRRGLARAVAHLSPGRDATGGMRGKLIHVQRILQAGIGVDLVNGNRPGNLARALSGKRFAGTRCTPG